MKEFLKKAGKWFENYWYHYKWTTIIGGIFLAFVIIGAAQLLGRDSYDVHLIYCGPKNIPQTDYIAIKDGLTACMPGDATNDGKLIPDLTAIVYVPAATAQEYLENGINFDSYQNAQSLTTFNTEMMNGQSLIYILDESVFLEEEAKGVLRPLSEVFGEAVANAYDAYGITLSDTVFGQAGASAYFPEDTVLCLRIKSSVSGNVNANWDAIYTYHEDMFRNMVMGRTAENP